MKNCSVLITTLVLGLICSTTEGANFKDIVVEKEPSFIIHESDKYRCWFPSVFQVDADTLIVSIQTEPGNWKRAIVKSPKVPIMRQ